MISSRAESLVEAVVEVVEVVGVEDPVPDVVEAVVVVEDSAETMTVSQLIPPVLEFVSRGPMPWMLTMVPGNMISSNLVTLVNVVVAKSAQRL